MSLFTIFSPRIAATLKNRGFNLVKIEPSKKNPNKVVYMFENTLNFQIALQKLLEKK